VLKLIKKAGYGFQSVDLGFCRFMEWCLVKNETPSQTIQMPLICVCGPPRSGTTLSFQVLTQAFDTLQLTNLHYLFYNTPLVGLKISKALTRPYVSDYKSQYGFIKGLNGPAQAYEFWRYWCDQHLVEKTPSPPPERVRLFKREMNAIYSGDRRPLLTGFLGHSFYIDQLSKLFTKSFFVRIKRPMLASALSLMKFMNSLKDNKAASAVPRECQELAVKSIHETVACQIYHINKRLDYLEKLYRDRIVDLHYHDVCNSAHKTVNRLTKFIREKSIEIKMRQDVEIPESFRESRVNKDFNEDTRKIYEALISLIDEQGELSVRTE